MLQHLPSVLWCGKGSLAVEWLDPDESFNGIYLTTVIIPKLVRKLHPRGRARRRNIFGLNTDNVKPHVVSTDFCLFAIVKYRLEACMGETIEDLKEQVFEILLPISEEELMAAFLN